MEPGYRIIFRANKFLYIVFIESLDGTSDQIVVAYNNLNILTNLAKCREILESVGTRDLIELHRAMDEQIFENRTWGPIQGSYRKMYDPPDLKILRVKLCTLGLVIEEIILVRLPQFNADENIIILHDYTKGLRKFIKWSKDWKDKVSELIGVKRPEEKNAYEDWGPK